MGYIRNCADNRDFASQSNSPVLEPEKSKEIPAPTQDGKSVNDYCSIFHTYLVASGKVEEGFHRDLFIRGLSPKYKALCEPGLPFGSLIDRLINYEKGQILATRAGPDC